MKKTLCALSLCLFISACGFRPMYGNKFSSVRAIDAQMSQIEIGNIPNREGQYLRNALIDRFYSANQTQDFMYVLSVAPIQESSIDLDVTKTSDATRSQLRLKTHMTLVDKQTGEAVLQRNLSSISSYNVLTSEFATRVSEQNTQENALNDLASQIETQISLYLRR